MAWRIYYADGSTFEGDPCQAPPLGVICIVQPDPDHGFHVLDRFDFYWWADGHWWGGEIFGLWEHLSKPGWKAVKFGRTVDNETFRAIHARAVADARARRGGASSHT